MLLRLSQAFPPPPEGEILDICHQLAMVRKLLFLNSLSCMQKYYFSIDFNFQDHSEQINATNTSGKRLSVINYVIQAGWDDRHKKLKMKNFILHDFLKGALASVSC